MPKILLIGENGIDRWCYGTASRLSPECPTPVFLEGGYSENLGLAGNVYENLKSLRPNWDITFIHNKKPTIKTRYVDKISNYTLLRVDSNDNIKNVLLYENFYQELGAEDPEDFDALVWSDYGKGYLDEKVMQTVSMDFEELGIPVFCDTKKSFSDWSRHFFLVKINLCEYKRASEKANCPIELLLRNLCVTEGGNVIQLYTNWGRGEKLFPTKDVSINCLAGAGDSVLASVVIEYLETESLEKAMEYGNLAGAVAVGHRGVYAVKDEDIQQLKNSS